MTIIYPHRPPFSGVLCTLECTVKLGDNQFFNPLPDDKNLDRSKLKQIADDIFKYIQIEK